MRSDLAVSYEIVTHDRAGRERVHSYAGEDALAPGSVVLLGGRDWLLVRVEQQRVQARLARYRLALHHPDGHREAGAFRLSREETLPPALRKELATRPGASADASARRPRDPHTAS